MTARAELTDREDLPREDHYVQGSFFPIPKKLELYAATSRVNPDSDVGFKRSSDVLVGANWYWRGQRYQRLNVQLIDVKDSPASSTFGYYTRRHGRSDSHGGRVDAVLVSSAQALTRRAWSRSCSLGAGLSR
jgi:hypothetical protein